MGARRIIEVGTFTGYSALVMAQAMSEDGCLVALDVSEAWTAIAQRYWAEAGVQDRIELTLGPALATLDALLANGEAGRYDLAFIDADKENYGNYFERALVLLRPGGLICIDNTLWGGKVVDADARDAETQAIRALNAALKNDERVDLSLVPIGDGLTLARKRG
jgi:predicted O-methyltransferase YrrM